LHLDASVGPDEKSSLTIASGRYSWLDTTRSPGSKANVAEG